MPAAGFRARQAFGRTDWLLLALLAIAVIQLAAQFLVSRPTSAKRGTAAPSQASEAIRRAPGSPPTLQSQPWGDLEWTLLALEAPTEYLSNQRYPVDKLDWFLPPAEHARFLRQVGSYELTEEQRAVLGDATRWRVTTNGFRFSPDRALLLGLSRQAREQFYPLLARFPENIYHHVPFKFVSDDVDEWLQNCGLYTETTRQLMRLIYSRGPTLCLSDMAVFGNLPPDEFRRLLKCLTRVRMVVARLRVSPDSDVEALVRYWGSWEGSPSRRIRPLIESLAKTPGGGTINVAQLLPPFARERLYSFPDRADAATTRQNCVWSTMNFGSEKPDDRFFDVSYTMEVLRREYAQTESEPVLGDLIGLMNGRGDFLHWCVHIADGLVFTKNGGEALQPWTLMRVSDILALYSLDEPLKATTFRRKRLST